MSPVLSTNQPGNLGGNAAATYVQGPVPGSPAVQDTTDAVGGPGGTPLNAAAVNAALTAAAVNGLLTPATINGLLTAAGVAAVLAGVNLPTTGEGVAARAYRNGAVPIPAGTWTKIPVDTLSFDRTNGQMDVTVNHRYNCKYQGIYSIDALAEIASATTAFLAVYKNGVEWATLGTVALPGAQANVTVSGSDELPCNAGDYLEVWVWANAATNLTVGVSQNNYMSIAKVDN